MSSITKRMKKKIARRKDMVERYGLKKFVTPEVAKSEEVLDVTSKPNEEVEGNGSQGHDSTSLKDSSTSRIGSGDGNIKEDQGTDSETGVNDE